MSKSKLDLFAIIIRFVCGFLFGVVAGYFFMATIIVESQEQLLNSALFIGVFFGIIAIVFGDKFWHGLKNRFWW